MPSSLYLLGPTHLGLFGTKLLPQRRGLLLLGMALFLVAWIAAHFVLALLIGLHIAARCWSGIWHRPSASLPTADGTVPHLLPGRDA